jgi:hypothetical protein
MPITRVDSTLDKPPRAFRPRNKIEKDAYVGYNADEMHGLPVGVQIVGRRLEEEQVLEGISLRVSSTATELHTCICHSYPHPTDDRSHRMFQNVDPDYVVVIYHTVCCI